MIKAIPAAAVLALLIPPAQAAEEDPAKITPLFADDGVLDLTLTGPIKDIARQAQRSTEARPATLSAAGETHAIELSARGVSRRKKENCSFPPLRIAFTQKPGDASLFHKQKRVKLVTHCNGNSRAEQTLLREYAAYRLYNLVTPESFRVRLARITYRDGGEEVATKPGFLIEDADDSARRVGMKEVDIGDINSSRVNRDDAARFALFQYMIGNTDWAMVVGPDPTDCCHNAKLLGADKAATSDLTPLPYDFDSAGLVDAPYAFPNAQIGTRSVKIRVYRGFCSTNSLVPREAERLKALRSSFEAEIRAVPGLEAKTQDTMIKYLGGFYRDIEDAKSIDRKIVRKCR